MNESFLNNFEAALITLLNQNTILSQYNWQAWESDTDIQLPRGYIELEAIRSVELSPLYQVATVITLEGKPKRPSLSEVQFELETVMTDDQLCSILQSLTTTVHYFGRMAEAVSLRRLIQGDKRNLVFSCNIFCGPIVDVATFYTLAGSGSGVIGEEDYFTVALPVDSVIGQPVTVTPSDNNSGGTFDPVSIVLTTNEPSASFSYTPAAPGDVTISVTNDGGLTDPAPLLYTVTSGYTGPPVLDASFSTTDRYDLLDDTGDHRGVGQVYASTGGKLAYSTFFLAKTGAPTGPVVSKLYSVAGVLPDVLLATSDPIDGAAIADYAHNQFNFSGANQIILVAGTQYAITCEYAGPNGIYFYFSYPDFSNPNGGSGVVNNGVNWITVGGDKEFAVYVIKP